MLTNSLILDFEFDIALWSIVVPCLKFKCIMISFDDDSDIQSVEIICKAVLD